MAITDNQLKTLCARVYADKKFRSRLLKDANQAKEAARELGIKLSKAEVQLLINGAEQIIAAGKRFDAQLKAFKIFFYPLPALVSHKR